MPRPKTSRAKSVDRGHATPAWAKKARQGEQQPHHQGRHGQQHPRPPVGPDKAGDGIHGKKAKAAGERRDQHRPHRGKAQEKGPHHIAEIERYAAEQGDGRAPRVIDRAVILQIPAQGILVAAGGKQMPRQGAGQKKQGQ